MGYRHTREEILDAAAAVAVEGGMAALTFGAVGRRLGISDRMIVYYFPTKPALVIAVAEKLGAGLEMLLEAAFGSERLHREDLLRRAWPALAAESNDRVFSLFFEIVGLAAAAQQPYDALGPALLQRWVDWLTPHVLAEDEQSRRESALAVVAQVEGLLLVREMLGKSAGEAAARAAGVSPAIPG